MAALPNKPHWNIVVLGQPDSGRSTSIGHFLFQSGAVPRQILQIFETEAHDMGRDDTKHAWVLDKLRHQHELQQEVNAQHWQFETPHARFTIRDIPGHRNFLKNIVAGWSAMDCAILVVSARQGEFEAGCSLTGQVPSHMSLAAALGVKQVIVCVNKMDDATVEYAHDRYEQIETRLVSMLEASGFSRASFQLVPISGLLGDNLIAPSANLPWYQGPTLFQALDALPRPVSDEQRPLRMPLDDVFKIGGIGTVPRGRVAYGILRPGMNITFSPSQIQAQVRCFEIGGSDFQHAEPGHVTAFSMTPRIDHQSLRVGMVVSSSEREPAKEVSSFEAYLVVLVIPDPAVSQLEVRWTATLVCHTSRTRCQLDAVLEKLDARTGRSRRADLSGIKVGEVALVRIAMTRPVCVERFADYPKVGRFLLRDPDLRRTLAVGIIKSVSKSTPDTTTSQSKTG